jgi:hypothetical protein
MIFFSSIVLADLVVAARAANRTRRRFVGASARFLFIRIRYVVFGLIGKEMSK